MEETGKNVGCVVNLAPAASSPRLEFGLSLWTLHLTVCRCAAEYRLEVKLR